MDQIEQMEPRELKNVQGESFREFVKFYAQTINRIAYPVEEL